MYFLKNLKSLVLIIYNPYKDTNNNQIYFSLLIKLQFNLLFYM